MLMMYAEKSSGRVQGVLGGPVWINAVGQNPGRPAWGALGSPRVNINNGT